MNMSVSLFAFLFIWCCSEAVTGEEDELRSEPPCAEARLDVLIRHKDVVACMGGWTGHIGDQGDDLCHKGWHVCSWNDKRMLRSISWYDATHISGCFAINAVHTGFSCISCTKESTDGETAAIGADCIKYNRTAHSCFGKGKIDASFTPDHFSSCHYAPWITGVLCCRDRKKGQKPDVIVSPQADLYLPVGSNVKLNCKAKGIPIPELRWFKDGTQLQTWPWTKKYQFVGDGLTITDITIDDQGFYQCMAHNKFGFSLSYGSNLKVRELMDNVTAQGCKNSAAGKSIRSREIVICEGRWKGHIKQTSRQLCARGWRVCSVKDRLAFQSLSWDDVTENIPGCYAYNAASSKYSVCTKCSPRKSENRMAGIGRDCGQVQDLGYSCLRNGRIDVSSVSLTTNGGRRRKSFKRKLKSCNFVKGVTSGVVCCKKKSKISKAERKQTKCKCVNGGMCDRSNKCRCKTGFSGAYCQHSKRTVCTKPCMPNSYCSLRGECKCSKGYKLSGSECIKVNNNFGKIAPPVAAICPHQKCLNGGFCRKGQCVCPLMYGGALCDVLVLD